MVIPGAASPRSTVRAQNKLSCALTAGIPGMCYQSPWTQIRHVGFTQWINQNVGGDMLSHLLWRFEKLLDKSIALGTLKEDRNKFTGMLFRLPFHLQQTNGTKRHWNMPHSLFTIPFRLLSLSLGPRLIERTPGQRSLSQAWGMLFRECLCLHFTLFQQCRTTGV